MSFLLIVQEGGGSTAEAMSINQVFGPYDTFTEANDEGTRIYETLRLVSEMHRDEMLTQVIHIPDTDPGPAVQAYIDKETEYWTS